jgi:predicted XRE-type DNA-binding protein
MPTENAAAIPAAKRAKTARKKRRARKGVTAGRRGVKRRRRYLPNDTKLRQQLGKAFQRRCERFGMTREIAAAIIGEASSQISRLMTGYWRDFSVERLLNHLTMIGANVTITIDTSVPSLQRGAVKVVTK